MGGSRFCETIAGGGAKPARRSRFRTYFRRRHGWKENRLSRLFRRSAVVAERPLPAQRHPQVESSRRSRRIRDILCRLPCGRPRPQAGNLNLGVGELLTYDASEPNMSWLGWPGMQFEAVDADGDGDFDIYGIRTDGGTWLQRNIGSNSEPRFLPRSRALPTDRLPSPELSYITLDWDGDGVSDRVRFRRHPRTNRYHNMKGDIVVELTRNGKRTPQVVHTPDGRPVEFTNSSWSALKAADMDNDGRPRPSGRHGQQRLVRIDEQRCGRRAACCGSEQSTFRIFR